LPAKNPGQPDAVLGEGNFYALAVIGDAIYATSNGDDTKGWVNRAMVKDGKVVSYERFLATKEATGVDAPVGVAVQPEANNLVVGQMGEITVPNDSLLTFYNPKTGKMIMNLPTGLFDISGLAYSPKRQLYATDFAWMDTTEGGLFQIVAQREGDKQGVKAEKIAALDKPTALAFGADGALYITVIGTAEGGKKGGKLLKVAAGL
jgi:DNA-binding beta-propeller fold protein YncE